MQTLRRETHGQCVFQTAERDGSIEYADGADAIVAFCGAAAAWDLALPAAGAACEAAEGQFVRCLSRHV